MGNVKSRAPRSLTQHSCTLEALPDDGFSPDCVSLHRRKRFFFTPLSDGFSNTVSFYSFHYFLCRFIESCSFLSYTVLCSNPHCLDCVALAFSHTVVECGNAVSFHLLSSLLLRFMCPFFIQSLSLASCGILLAGM